MRACPRCLSSYIDPVQFCGIDGTQIVEVDRDPLLGQTIDRYQISDVLGRGAMGCVYRATHVVLNRDFALKVLFGDFASNNSLIDRFRREAEALSRLRHTNIISVVDFLTTDRGLNVLIMEYLPGPTLSKEIKERAPLPPVRAALIVRQIAAGLGEAHRRGIIHRDVKPSNVLLVPEGKDEVVKLLDFGVVAVQDTHDQNRLTAAGKILGTPNYMAPEQIGDQPVAPSVDLYALGVLIYEMLTGKPPFEAPGVNEVLMMHLGKAPPPLPPADGLEQLTMRLLEKDPKARPHSAAQVIEEVDRLIAQWSAAGVDIPRVRAASMSGAPRPDADDQGRKKTILRLGIAGGVAAAAVASVMIAVRHGGVSEAAPSALPQAEEVILRDVIPDAGTAEAEATAPPSNEAEAAVHARTDRRGSGRTQDRHAASDKPAEKRLEAALAGRNFEKADLLLMTPTTGLWKRYQAAVKSGKRDSASTIVNDLVEVIKIVPVSTEVLDRRLTRLLKRIEAAKRNVPANLMEDIDDRYLHLRSQVSLARTDEDRAVILSRVARLEYELDKLRRGV